MSSKGGDIMRLTTKIRLLLRDNDFLRHWVRPLIAWFVLKVLKRKQRLLQKYGFEAVREVYEAAKMVEMPCYADCGTLLGIVREGGFIAHDADMDFSLMPDNGKLRSFYDELVKRGFLFERFVLFDNRLKEFTMSYKDVGIDFFQRHYSSDKTKLLAYATRKDGFWPVFHLPVPTGFIIRTIRGVQVAIPENYEAILECLYGDWRTPVVKWADTMAPRYDKDYGVHKSIMSRDTTTWLGFLSKC